MRLSGLPTDRPPASRDPNSRLEHVAPADVRRPRPRRRARCRNLPPHRYGKTQRRRSTDLACRRTAPHRRSSVSHCTSFLPGIGRHAKPTLLPPDNQTVALFAGCLRAEVHRSALHPHWSWTRAMSRRQPPLQRTMPGESAGHAASVLVFIPPCPRGGGRPPRPPHDKRTVLL